MKTKAIIGIGTLGIISLATGVRWFYTSLQFGGPPFAPRPIEHTISNKDAVVVLLALCIGVVLLLTSCISFLINRRRASRSRAA